MTHLQSVLLMIAQDVDRLCKENGITYFLDGGTALGAVRHGGFIPWDDDFDIIMLPEDYVKFVRICKLKLNKDKYVFKEAFVDYPMHMSKLILKNTFIDEVDAYPMEERGIYIDIFCFDYGSDNAFMRLWQLFFSRIWVAYELSQKPYTTSNFFKKVVLKFVWLLQFDRIRKLVNNQRRSNRKTNILSMGWARTRKKWSHYYCPKDYFAKSKNVKFEGVVFPVCNNIDGYLKICFGDYMKLPPKEKRVGLHIKDVDFGVY